MNNSARFGSVGVLLAVGLLEVGTAVAADPEDQGSTEEVAVVKTEGSGEKATVTVESTGDQVTVAQVTERMTATGVGSGGGTVTVMGMAYKDLCMSPCTFEIKPGMYELMVYGDGVTGASNRFQLRSGTNKLQADPGSAGLYMGGVWVTALGLVGMVLGGVFIAVSDDVMEFQALPLTLISAGVTTGGIVMIASGITSFEKVGSREPAPRTAGGPAMGLRLQGAF